MGVRKRSQEKTHSRASRRMSSELGPDVYSPGERILCEETTAGEKSRRIAAGRYGFWILGAAGWASVRVPRTSADVCVVRQRTRQQRKNRERNRDLGLKLAI